MKNHLSLSECWARPVLLDELDAVGITLLRDHVPDHVLEVALWRIIKPLLEDTDRAQYIRNLAE